MVKSDAEPLIIMTPGMRWLIGIASLLVMGSAYMFGAGGNPFSGEWSSVRWYQWIPLAVWLLLSSLMGFGAVVSGVRQYVGFKLAQIGAVFATVFVMPFDAILAFATAGPWDTTGLALRLLFGSSVMLVIVSDVALIRMVRARKRALAADS